MGDYKLPELPSDEELGITDADREAHGEDAGPGPGAPQAQAPPDEKAGKKAKKKKARAAGPPPQGRWNRWRGPLTLALLIAAGWISSSRNALPAPVPANAPDTVFSSARAMSMLVEIASESHPTGSPEHARVRGYLVDRLESLGLEAQVQTTTSVLEAASSARAAIVRNVLARLEGTQPTGAILLTAHYDSRGISRGAGDDGSGVVSILEAVRALRASGAPVRNDVIVLFTDAEELGMLGARAFVKEHTWMRDVSVVLSFEMRGAGGPSIMLQTGDRNGWIVDALDRFASRPLAYSVASEVYDRLPNDTDFTPFLEAGVQGLNFAAIGRANVYHQEYDAPARVSEASIQHHGLQALGALRYLGAADLSTVDGPNVVYFTLPVLGLVSYRQVWGLGLAAGLLVLLAGGIMLSRRKAGRVRGLLVGLAVAVLVCALAFGAAYLLRGWLPRFHPEYGSLPGAAFHGEGWYVVAVLGISFALVTAAHALARRWLPPTELELGALALPVLLGVVLAVAMPLGAPMVQWPATAAVLAVVVPSLLGERLRSTAGWAVTVVLAATVLAFAVPLVELLWVALSFEAAGVLAILVAGSLYLCLPALDALRHPNVWWAPVAGVVAGGVSLGIGILSAGPSAEEPAPSTLAYAYEHGTGSAMWVTAPAADDPSERAMAWAAERAGSEFGSTRDLSGFGYPGGEVPVTSAPVVSATPPSVTVLSDTISGGTRRVRLGVRSEIGAEMLRFQLAARGDTRLLSIDGKQLTIPGSIEWVEHWGTPDSMVTLDLEMPASAPIDLFVIEHLLRPERLLGDDAFSRPPDLAPDVTRLSDRAMFRFSVAAFADPRYGLIRRPAPVHAPPAAAPDTAAVADTSAVPDTGVALPDTRGAVPDTGAIPPDRGGTAAPSAVPDTGAVVDRGPAFTGKSVISAAARSFDTCARPAERAGDGVLFIQHYVPSRPHTPYISRAAGEAKRPRPGGPRGSPATPGRDRSC